MSIVASKATAVAQVLIESTAGQAARRVEQVAAEEVRRFKEAVLQEVVRLSLEGALGLARRRKKPEAPVPWPCPGCGPRLASQVMRNGTYQRRPLTQEGPVLLHMPQLVCRGCGKAIPFVLSCLPRWRRLWCDVEHALVQAYLGGHSYRTVARQVAGCLGLMTAWRTVQRAAEGRHQPPPTPALVTLGLDEHHTRIRGKPAWFLVARGAKASGGGHYLGALLSQDRSQEAWELAIDGLGLGHLSQAMPIISDGDAALEGAVSHCLPKHQLRRCAWHLLHNVGEWLKERLPGPEHQGQRRGLLAAAQAVVNAPTPPLRHRSLAVLGETAPWLAHALARSLRRVPYPGQNSPRTNNVCERGFREWRRRTRPMDGFGSWQGARNFATLWMLKENARAADQDWMEVIMP